MNPTFHPYGDRALLIQWEQKIDPDINAKVVKLEQAISAAKIAGVQFCIPAYCSLTVGFDPVQIAYAELYSEVKALISRNLNHQQSTASRRQISIPVCYDEAYAPDLEWLSRHTGLKKDQIIEVHTQTTFRVYMLGFMPGFPYMGTLPKVLETPRKTSPRTRVPAGAVGLAGLQTGIYPIESPGGWQIIGRTPLPIFDPERESPFLLQAGDEVRFQAIDEQTFEEIKKIS